MDLGTGGGVPGILISILRPDLTISLCDSVGKKAKVVDEIVQELDLQVAVFNARLEDLLEDFRFDSVVTRAVGPLWKICTWFQGHWHSFDRLLAIKGPRWAEERGEARHRGVDVHTVGDERATRASWWGSASVARPWRRRSGPTSRACRARCRCPRRCFSRRR